MNFNTIPPTNQAYNGVKQTFSASNELIIFSMTLICEISDPDHWLRPKLAS